MFFFFFFLLTISLSPHYLAFWVLHLCAKNSNRRYGDKNDHAVWPGTEVGTLAMHPFILTRRQLPYWIILAKEEALGAECWRGCWWKGVVFCSLILLGSRKLDIPKKKFIITIITVMKKKSNSKFTISQIQRLSEGDISRVTTQYTPISSFFFFKKSIILNP